MTDFWLFIKDNPLYFLLGFACIATFVWLMLVRDRLKAKWYVLAALSVLHIVFGVLFVKCFAFLEAPDGGFSGAMSLYGAVFFMPVLYFAGAKLFRRDTGQVFDMFTVPLVFTLACARVNCIFSGCCLGKIIPFITSRTARWPTREAELVFYAVFLAVIISKIVKRKNHGEIYPLYLMCYGAFRFVIEFFRESETTNLFHRAHIWSAVAVIAGASFYFEIYRKSKKKGLKQK